MTNIKDAQLWTGCYSFMQEGMDAASARMSDLGIDVREFLVIDYLERSSSQVDIGKALSIPKASVTGYVKALEAKSLIRREINRDDLRRYQLRLTAAGIITVSNARKILTEVFDERLAKLEHDEQTEIKRLIEKLKR